MYKRVILILLLAINSIGCKSVDEEEIAIIHDFLAWDWYDMQVEVWNKETIPFYTSVSFTKDVEGLRYKIDERYSASFGNDQKTSEGKVEIEYDDDDNEIEIKLLDKNGEILRNGYIKIPRNEIKSGLTRQIELRKQINEIHNQRVFTQLYEGDYDQLGIFESKILKTKEYDYYVKYFYFPVYHIEKIAKFSPYKLSGFRSPGVGGSALNLELKESYHEKPKLTQHELNYSDIIPTFTKSEMIELLEELQRPLKFYGSNIDKPGEFNGDTFRLELDQEWRNLIKNSDPFETSELYIPVVFESFSFFDSWYGKRDKSVSNVIVELLDNGKYSLYLNLDYQTGSRKSFRVYTDKLNDDRIHFFNEVKNFTLVL
jgi:hypothetical protein